MFSNKSNDRNFRSPQASTCSNCGNHVSSGDLFCSSCGSKVFSRVAPFPVQDSSSRLDSFRGHIQIIGVVEIVFGVFALIIGLLLAFLTPFLFYLLRSDFLVNEMDNPAILHRIAPFLSVFLFGIALLFLVYAFVSILSGKRLLRYQSSGRLGTMVIAALNLFNFPFGTIFGVASLYVLSRPEVEQLYSK